MAEALVLAIAGGPELLARTQKAYFDANKSSVDQVSSSLGTLALYLHISPLSAVLFTDTIQKLNGLEFINAEDVNYLILSYQ
jgi:hypothetical protein